MSAMSSSSFNEERSENSEEISDDVFVESDDSLEHLSEDIKNFSPQQISRRRIQEVETRRSFLCGNKSHQSANYPTKSKVASSFKYQEYGHIASQFNNCVKRVVAIRSARRVRSKAKHQYQVRYTHNDSVDKETWTEKHYQNGKLEYKDQALQETGIQCSSYGQYVGKMRRRNVEMFLSTFKRDFEDDRTSSIIPRSWSNVEPENPEVVHCRSKMKKSENLGVSVEEKEAVGPFYVISKIGVYGVAAKSKQYRIGDEIVDCVS